MSFFKKFETENEIIVKNLVHESWILIIFEFSIFLTPVKIVNDFTYAFNVLLMYIKGANLKVPTKSGSIFHVLLMFFLMFFLIFFQCTCTLMYFLSKEHTFVLYVPSFKNHLNLCSFVWFFDWRKKCTPYYRMYMSTFSAVLKNKHCFDLDCNSHSNRCNYRHTYVNI